MVVVDTSSCTYIATLSEPPSCWEWADVILSFPGGSPGTIETIMCNYVAAGS